MRKVFLDDLPVHINGSYQGKIDWANSVGCKIKFIYGDIEGELYIKSYDSKSRKLTVEYNNILKTIATQSLLSGAIGGVLGVRTKDYKYTVGDIVKDNNRNIEILECIRIKYGRKNNDKGYRAKCLICGYEFNMLEGNLHRGYGCACCSNQVVVKGINDIATTNPELVKYFKDKDIIFNKCITSGNKTIIRCPICYQEKVVDIYSFGAKGFNCPQCSDKISFGQKFVLSFLRDYIESVTTEYHPIWGKGKRYDFYFRYNNKDIIVEVHGIQHYQEIKRRGAKPLSEEIVNDNFKKELALKNNIDNKNYIVLNCKTSSLKQIKNSVINSSLMTLLNINEEDVDWGKHFESTIKSYMEKCWNIWNEGGNSVLEIAKLVNLSTTTVRRYLHRGNEMLKCKYDAKSEYLKGVKSGNNGIKVKCVELDLVFNSFTECAIEMKKYTGLYFNRKVVSKCAKSNKTYNQFTFKIIN